MADTSDHYLNHELAVADLITVTDEITAKAMPLLDDDVAFTDQLQAAARESREAFARGVQAVIKDSDKVFTYGTDPVKLAEAVARITVALHSRPPIICKHLRRSPVQPSHALLSINTLLCSGCVMVFTCDNPPEDADRCDWCGARKVKRFWPYAMGAGMMQASGDACDHCNEKLRALLTMSPGV